jgi:hypothetical protein
MCPKDNSEAVLAIIDYTHKLFSVQFGSEFEPLASQRDV